MLNSKFTKWMHVAWTKLHQCRNSYQGYVTNTHTHIRLQQDQNHIGTLDCGPLPQIQNYIQKMASLVQLLCPIAYILVIYSSFSASPASSCILFLVYTLIGLHQV